ncbi:hypothetical protein [Clostridium estertheticum]|uniref:hypothetical protein n=1 Tax=Clostridium estertheticum TaxID=238834 RepID=UPI001C0BAAD5|nr:hypothetical protein [Clostridium estertheticum]MBU3173384.1 hypothetical protein [Clostridium estertheticum]
MNGNKMMEDLILFFITFITTGLMIAAIFFKSILAASILFALIFLVAIMCFIKKLTTLKDPSSLKSDLSYLSKKEDSFKGTPMNSYMGRNTRKVD